MNTLISAALMHIYISLYALVIAVIIALPLGILSVLKRKTRPIVTNLFGILRIIPSLAILLLLIPILGTGVKSAVIALVLLAIPPILLNTVAGIESVPEFMIETALSCGMTQLQIWHKVLIPLALPLILAGIKISAIEIIASATLAAKIGAGGLGEIIFTGLGLNRMDFLIAGGVSVAVLSSVVGIIFERLDRRILKYKF